MSRNHYKAIESMLRSDKLHVALMLLSLVLVVANHYRNPIYLLAIGDRNKEILIYDVLHDDSFYYLEIARNILDQSLSSFDGITRTNGYHPLWMLILVGLGSLVPIGSAPFGWLLTICVVVIVAGGTLFFHRLQKELASGHTWNLATVAYFVGGMHVSRGGMEVCMVFLFLPLLLLSLRRAVRCPSGPSSFVLGLMTGLLVLSRLDTILFVFFISLLVLIYVFSELYNKKCELFSTRRMCLFFVGLAPLVVYLLYNLVFYGHIVPISGRAKSLRLNGFFFSQKGFFSLLDKIRYEPYIGLFFLGTILSTPLVMVNLCGTRSFNDMVFASIILHPLVFWSFYLVTSDWPFWRWYYYPLSISFAFSLVLLGNSLRKRTHFFAAIDELLIVLVALALCALVAARYTQLRRTLRPYVPNAIMDAALQIRVFAKAHPGVYAIGDRAGAVGFALDQPLIQLEGIVGDDKMLESISMERDLVEVLQETSVDYYIATRPKRVGNCWDVQEPALPGSHAPRMRSRICGDPVFRYEGNGSATISVVERNTARHLDH